MATQADKDAANVLDGFFLSVHVLPLGPHLPLQTQTRNNLAMGYTEDQQEAPCNLAFLR